MDKKKKISIAVGGGIIILIVVVLVIWWFWGLRRGGGLTNQNNGSPQKLPTSSGITSAPTPSPVGDSAVEAGIKTIALTFAERYGSFSNQGDYDNLRTLNEMVSLKMKGTLETTINDQKVQTPEQSGYYGITSTALSAQVTAYDGSLGRATVVVTTQRQEARGTTANPRIFYQNLELKLVKSGDNWVVDEARWQ